MGVIDGYLSDRGTADRLLHAWLKWYESGDARYLAPVRATREQLDSASDHEGCCAGGCPHL